MKETSITKKERFIAFTNKEIESLFVIIKVMEKAKNVVKQFDKKVVNKRFITALENEIKNYSFGDFIFGDNEISFRIKYFDTLNDSLIISYKDRDVYLKDDEGNNVKFLGYISNNSQCFDIIMDKSTKRLKAEETLIYIDKTIINLSLNIDKLIDCIKNFDLYERKTNEIKRLIEQYKDEVPYSLQLSINTQENNAY